MLSVETVYKEEIAIFGCRLGQYGNYDMNKGFVLALEYAAREFNK